MIAWAPTVAVGLVSGVLSGMFGIGGGLVTTPAIRLLLGFPALIAVGTPLPVILPTAIAGAVSYARRGLIDIRAGLLMGAVGSVGSVAGAYFSRAAGGPAVLLVTAALILYVAGDLVRHQMRTAAGSAAALALEMPEGPQRAWRLALLGLAAGLYSGFLGLGGGFVVVPVLTRWLGVPLKRALGTSLVVVALLAIPGTIVHSMLGHVDPLLALVLIVGTVPGALLGARLSAAASERWLAVGFAALLAVTGIVLSATEIARLL